MWASTDYKVAYCSSSQTAKVREHFSKSKQLLITVDETDVEVIRREGNLFCGFLFFFFEIRKDTDT